MYTSGNNIVLEIPDAITMEAAVPWEVLKTIVAVARPASNELIKTVKSAIEWLKRVKKDKG
ncbi:MAG: hypothetical protein QXY49_00105 [Thermofilaceae archaeon]